MLFFVILFVCPGDRYGLDGSDRQSGLPETGRRPDEEI